MEDSKVLHNHIEGVVAWANMVAGKYHKPDRITGLIGPVFEVMHFYTLYKLESFETPEIKLREIVDTHYGELTARARAGQGIK